MRILVAACAGALAAVYLGVFLSAPIAALMGRDLNRAENVNSVLETSALLTGTAGAVWAWRAYPRMRAAKSLGSIGALIGGGVGLTLGIGGPVLLRFGGSRGALLGVFLTGPLGLMLGSLAGQLYAKFRRPPPQN